MAGTAARPVTGQNRSEAALSAAYSSSDNSISAAATLPSSCSTLDATDGLAGWSVSRAFRVEPRSVRDKDLDLHR